MKNTWQRNIKTHVKIKDIKGRLLIMYLIFFSKSHFHIMFSYVFNILYRYNSS